MKNILAYAFGNCDKCNGTLEHTSLGQSAPMLIQEASVTCKRCRSEFTLCTHCQTAGCPKCRGKLETALELAEQEGILF